MCKSSLTQSANSAEERAAASATSATSSEAPEFGLCYIGDSSTPSCLRTMIKHEVCLSCSQATQAPAEILEALQALAAENAKLHMDPTRSDECCAASQSPARVLRNQNDAGR